MPATYTVRDADIPKLLLSGLQRPYGFFGSDIAIEQSATIGLQLNLSDVAPLRGLRFAILARADKLQRVQSLIDSAQPINVATSNPRVVAFLAQAYGMRLTVTRTMSGKVETAANMFPEQLDAVVDMVRSGLSLRRQNLRIVADDLLPVSLLAAWPAQQANINLP